MFEYHEIIYVKGNQFRRATGCFEADYGIASQSYEHGNYEGSREIIETSGRLNDRGSIDDLEKWIRDAESEGFEQVK